MYSFISVEGERDEPDETLTKKTTLHKIDEAPIIVGFSSSSPIFLKLNIFLLLLVFSFCLVFFCFVYIYIYIYIYICINIYIYIYIYISV